MNEILKDTSNSRDTTIGKNSHEELSRKRKAKASSGGR